MRYSRGYRAMFSFALLATITLSSGPVSASPGFSSKINRIVADIITHRVAGHGFESVAASVQPNWAVVTYENRLYRSETRAVKEVLKLVVPELRDKKSIILIPQNRQIPVVAITVLIDEYEALLTGEISDERFARSLEVSFNVDAIWKKIQRVPRKRSFARIDLLMRPRISAQFGNYDDPLETQSNILPELRASLWPGMQLTGQVVIPLQDNYVYGERNRRPGVISLNQTLRLPRSTFLSTTVGYFSENRFGIDLNVRKYLMNGHFAVGARLGYTGFASYSSGRWLYSSPDDVTALFQTEYRFSKIDFVLKAVAGQFLYKDKGIRVAAIRQFGEFDIGFYALVTEVGRNGGFSFSVPIFPRKYLSKGRITVRPVRAFSWEYRYRGFTNGGLQYETGSNIDDFIERLDPSYIKNQLTTFRGGRKRFK